MVVDTSARAHAVMASYLRSGNVRRGIVPGNNFIPFRAPKEVILAPANIKDPADVERVAQQYKPDIIDVCQDDALAAGVVDALQAAGFSVFGPSQAASRVEWDKEWSRDFMKRNGIPHPKFQVFGEDAVAKEILTSAYRDTPNARYFVKATGLCAGKGAIGVSTLEEALAAVKEMGSFGGAGHPFLVEEAMAGEEASFYIVSDGKTTKRLKSAQDHKTRDNFDAGPNTGGMGAVSPALVVQRNGLDSAIHYSIMQRTVRGLASEGHPYVGVLYGGIMLTNDGTSMMPQVVEFNARWGAPEAEVVVPGIQTPMDEIAQACLIGNLDNLDIVEDSLTRVCVVGASRGYPDSRLVSQVKGKQIRGLEDAMRMPNVTVFGAGIHVQDGKFFANGSRLFSLVADGRDVREARERALEAMARIYIEGNNLQYRTDIGHHDLERYYGG
ncbi:MAG: phosphoribosylamine--glycine ligase [Nanoarchaeota archaeon]